MTARDWIKHFVVYGLGIVLMNLLPALMIPIYTHRISPSIYGVLELLNRSQEILLLILSFGLSSAVATFYQLHRDDREFQKTIFSTFQLYISICSLAFILALLFFSSSISKMLFGSVGYKGAVQLILATTYFEVAFQSATLYLQCGLRSHLYVSTYTARSVLGLLLNLVFVYWWRWGLRGILLATFLHTFVFGLAATVYVLQHTGVRLDFKLLRKLLAFGAPLMIGGFSMFILNNGDRYFLQVFRTSSELGVYGVGYRLGTVALALLMYPFTKIWSVTMVDISRQPDGPTQLGRIATYLIGACIFTTLGLSLFGSFIVKLLAERSYWGASRLIPIVGLAYVFYAWSVVMDASFYVTKRTVFKIYDITLAGCVALALYWLLIPRYGMMGAAWATVGGFASFLGFKAIFAQRIFRIEYEGARIAWLFFIGVILYVTGAHLPNSPNWAAVATRILALVAFPAFVWLLVLKKHETQAVRKYCRIVQVRFYNQAEFAKAGLWSLWARR